MHINRITLKNCIIGAHDQLILLLLHYHYYILSLSMIETDVIPSMTLSLGFIGITVTFTTSVPSIIVSSIASISKHVLLPPG